MKKYIKKNLVFAAMLLLSSWLSAQEFVERISTVTIDTTIIREVADGKWLVYGCRFPSSAFMGSVEAPIKIFHR